MRTTVQLLFGIAGLLLFSAMLAPPAQGQGVNGLPYNTPTPTPHVTPTPTPDPAINQPPLAPEAIGPRNGVVVNTDAEFISLSASAFHDPNPPDAPNGQHKASQWKVYTRSPVVIMTNIYPPPDPTVIILDSGPTHTALTSFPLPKHLLTAGQAYFWMVRYCDASGQEATQWSPWSIPACFILGPLPLPTPTVTPTPTPTPDPAINHPPLQPEAIEPRNGAVINGYVMRDGAVVVTDGEFIHLLASAFHDPNPPDAPNGQHKASQWLVCTENPIGVMGANTTNPSGMPVMIVLDSGPTHEHLTVFPLPKKLLKAGGKYNWRVRYGDGSGNEATQWSPWSVPAVFIMGPLPEPTPTVTPTPKPTPDPAINHPPLRPESVEPRNGAILRPQGEFIILRATAFHDFNPPTTPNGKHKCSQWQVYTENQLAMTPGGGGTDPASNTNPSGGRIIVLDSGPTTKSLIVFLLSKKLLKSGTMYFWTVRYADASGQAATQWSPWSIPARFATAPEVIKNLKPERLKVGLAKPGLPLYSDKVLPIILRLPQTLWSQFLIGTRSTDAKTSGPGTLISFSSDLPVSVVVAYDDRATTLPHWLWAYKPYRPLLPIVIGYTTNPGMGTATAGMPNNTLVRGSDVSILPLPPDRIPPGLWKLIVSDREAPSRRLLFKEFKVGDAIGLGNNLPAPGVDTKTTVSVRMYGVIVLPKWMGVNPPPPVPMPTPRPTVKPPATDTTTNIGGTVTTTGVKPLATSSSGATTVRPRVTPAVRPTPRPLPADRTRTRPTVRPRVIITR